MICNLIEKFYLEKKICLAQEVFFLKENININNLTYIIPN